MGKPLWKFQWQGGGFNQVYANTRKEALAEVEKKFQYCNLKILAETLAKVKDEKAYWDAIPPLD